MDHNSPAGSCCAAMAEKRRKAEPFIFFFGVLLLIAVGIALLTREAYSEIGPKSAQTSPHSAH